MEDKAPSLKVYPRRKRRARKGVRAAPKSGMDQDLLDNAVIWYSI